MNELCFLLAPYRGFRPVRNAGPRVTTGRFGRPVAPAATPSLPKAS